MKMITSILSHDTKVSIALMLVMIGAACTFVIMREKVNTQGQVIAVQGQKIDVMKEDISTIKSDLKTISYQLQGIDELKFLLRDKLHNKYTKYSIRFEY